MLRAFFLGFMQIHILHHAVQEPIYGAAMIAELKRHGYDLSPGTLYPVLHTMEEEGYLSVSTQVVEGKVRKYYRATEQGRLLLEETLPKLRELVSEVLEGQGPSPLPVPLEEEGAPQSVDEEALHEERMDHDCS
jgi:DNA-binding PadR family transcriptional regulator